MPPELCSLGELTGTNGIGIIVEHKPLVSKSGNFRQNGEIIQHGAFQSLQFMMTETFSGSHALES